MTVIFQVVVVILFAPFLQGWIKKCKARMQGRIGPSIWQPYRDLRKLFAKDLIFSDASSWITRFAPYAIIGLMITACAILPVFTSDADLLAGGSIFVFFYLLAFTRLCTVLLGLDSGSAFAGMGAGRDMLFSILAEPTIFISLLALGLPAATFSFAGIIAVSQHDRGLAALPVTLLVFVALFLVLIAETGRLPVDNPDTHLELTMVHEGMMLELSGRNLALVTWSAAIRQVLWFTVLLNVCLPWPQAFVHSLGSMALGLLWWVIKCLILGILVAAVESLSAKFRIFVVPRYLSFALTLAVVAVLADAVL